MNQDPFDQMRRNNPVPPDQVPAAPMSVADRIVGLKRSVPGWAVAAAAAAAVVVIGGGTLLLVNRPANTVVADTSTSSAPVASSASVASSSPDTSPLPLVTLELLPPVTNGDAVVVYLIIDDPTATEFSSQSLIPVARSTANLSSQPLDLPGTALGFLLAGPTPGEADSVPALTTAIPDGTLLLGLDIADGVATVNLSAEFAAASGSFSEIARLDQLIYTLTRFGEINGVRLQVEGVAVDVFGSHGVVLDDPVVRTEFDTTLPAILIDTPSYWAEAGNPLMAAGTANVFEASVSLALVDGNGLIIWEGFTTATCGTGCRGDWAVEIPYDVEAPQMGALIAWEESARDGSQVNVREHPVWLVPASAAAADTTTTSIVGSTCSAGRDRVWPVLVDQPGLSAEDASMRAAIFEAAVGCDWDSLRALQVEGFQYSFGINDDAIGYWQQLEDMGEEPIRFLAELLNRPFGTQPGPGTSEYYSWPSAFVTEWSDVPDADREALRPLYGDDDFAVFSDFGGYFGYRVGILDGSWVYFIAGD